MSRYLFARSSRSSITPRGRRRRSVSYDGQGGFPIASPLLRLVTAIAEGDWNIMLSNPLTADSRMMIHRKRAGPAAARWPSSSSWDEDPYMVITDAGRLVWIVDGYMTSDAHPYSRGPFNCGRVAFNYIRNSVKATVDAYDGNVHMYVFDHEDPLIQRLPALVPGSVRAASSAMPADLRAHAALAGRAVPRAGGDVPHLSHARSGVVLQSRRSVGSGDLRASDKERRPQTVTPIYMVMTLPGETQPEFLLTIPFTPRNKQNLIGADGGALRRTAPG